MTSKTQMELGLKVSQKNPRPTAPKGVRRSAWWFEQMRRAVDEAMSWQAAPAYSEQVYMASLQSSGRE
jgi:hypothetical protein